MWRFFVLSTIVVSGATGPRAQTELGSEFNPRHLSDTIVVTANRLATPTSRVASSITVITADQIARSQAGMVSEVLRSIPGVDVVQSGGPGQQTSIFVRGANSEHVLVMVDGIEINDPSSPNNAVNLANLPVDNIDRVEVLRGPQSVLYGSDAIGGVIQIFTRRPVGKPTVSLVSEVGSFQTYYEQVEVKSGREDVDYSITLSRLDSDGISATAESDKSESDGYNNTTVSAVFGLQPSDRVGIRFTGRNTTARAGLDQQWGNLDDPNYSLDSKEKSFSGRLEHVLMKGRLWQQFGAYITDYSRSTSDSLDLVHPYDAGESDYHGKRVKFDWQAAARLSNSDRLTLGVEREEERLGQAVFLASEYGGYQNNIIDVRSRTTGLYTHAEHSYQDRLTIMLGVRWDDHGDYGDKTTSRTALAWCLPQVGLKLRTSYGTGIKVPSLYQLFDAETGNPELQTETSHGWEAGLELNSKTGNGGISITFFHTRFDDLIQFDGAAWRMANIARARIRGVEVLSGYHARNLSATLTYTYTRALDGRTDEPLLRRPRHKASFKLGYFALESLTCGAEVNYTGNREDINYDAWPAQRVTLADYAVLNLVIGHQVGSWLNLSARIDNLFDADYEEVLRFNHTPRSVSFRGTFTL